MIAVAIRSSSISRRRVSRLPRSLVLTRNWAILSLVLAGRATSIAFGFERNLSDSFLIGGGIDADKSWVRRLAGRWAQLFSNSGEMHMSSYLSASEIKHNDTPV